MIREKKSQQSEPSSTRDNACNMPFFKRHVERADREASRPLMHLWPQIAQIRSRLDACLGSVNTSPKRPVLERQISKEKRFSACHARHLSRARCAEVASALNTILNAVLFQARLTHATVRVVERSKRRAPLRPNALSVFMRQWGTGQLPRQSYHICYIYASKRLMVTSPVRYDQKVDGRGRIWRSY